MRRREFITLIGSLSALRPFAALAQARKVPLVGVLMPFEKGDEEGERRQNAFQNGLEKFGWRSGQNIRIEYRWVGSNRDRIRDSAIELIGLRPDVILASSALTLAPLQRQTGTIPIVFTNIADPVGSGFVASLARPGGNITGFSPAEFSMYGKLLGLLKEAVPNLTLRFGCRLVLPEARSFNLNCRCTNPANVSLIGVTARQRRSAAAHR
jgi:putative tryptophan/tyrosine transport system substrate-binding protein